jgi:deglycase
MGVTIAYTLALSGGIMAKVAFVLDNTFEDSEFAQPYEAVREAGHEAVVIGLEKGKKVSGKKGKETFVVERGPDGADVSEFDALVIPGGYSPDHLRTNPQIVDFVRGMTEAGKPVAAICHAGWLLAEADVARGRTLTSWPSIRTDLENAGASWVDKEVVEDGNLITSRKPADLPAFCDALLKRLG